MELIRQQNGLDSKAVPPLLRRRSIPFQQLIPSSGLLPELPWTVLIVLSLSIQGDVDDSFNPPILKAIEIKGPQNTGSPTRREAIRTSCFPLSSRYPPSGTDRRPRWPSSKVTALGSESSRFETRFH
ncbi:hypothetical protein AVEN_167325-1 [Araneus ventricosus]|uniref:Uncharacterized protein n=1 Tax=Araneus ventricosus TaxID=182803 RepID=A0A4Y2DBT2_ARAVE|nr:hypothetical protein AVEN_167325-1 [Araneus ventricosus]